MVDSEDRYSTEKASSVQSAILYDCDAEALSVEVLLDTPPGSPKNCPEARGDQSIPVQSRRPLGFGQVFSDQPAASRLEHCELVPVIFKDSFSAGGWTIWVLTLSPKSGLESRLRVEAASSLSNIRSWSKVCDSDRIVPSPSRSASGQWCWVGRPRPCKRENLKLGAKRSTGKFAGKVPGKFTGDNPAIDLNPALDSVRPNSPTLRTRTVRYTQDVRQHTQDVRGCPCVSVSAHRTSVSTHRTSVSTRRTSVSTRRTSVAVRVCPCFRQCTQDVRQHTQDVRQHTQDVRQHTQDVRGCPCVCQHTQDVRQYTQDVRQHTKDVRQHTQDVRGCPCVSVCPSAHAGRPSVNTGRPSAHKGRPWPSVSTQRTSVGRPSAHTGPSSVHRGSPWPSVRPTQGVRQHTQASVFVRVSVRYTQASVSTPGRPSVHTRRSSAQTGCLVGVSVSKPSMLALSVDCIGMLTTISAAALLRGLSVPCTDLDKLMPPCQLHLIAAGPSRMD
ncbi:hypothetical protein IGI04_042176 [Brassica rapa subsp. trilocularis]|uniref:Uncharacterized protein n=1 Tax=Brassica rapa subsp. trilocularis TaxID=1813537 RepID=A0ABQ7KMY4_BRACM|nr:hypothetical protein IGI04_042176 [Brassica rapa subsp. trilocularis]